MREKKTVLVIDDNPQIRKLFNEVLNMGGFDTYCAESGISALDLIKEAPFDIIISDYSMPGMNGAELVEVTRLLCPDALIIGMSALPNEDAFLEAGADAFLQKPIYPQQLLAAVMRGK